MSRTMRLTLWFVVGLLIASIFSAAIFLVSVAPTRTKAAIETVTIASQTETPVRIFGHGFTCTTGKTFEQCNVPLQTHPLEITVTYTSAEEKGIAGCQATYAAQNIGCTAAYGGYIGGVRFLSSVMIESTLGLSRQQLQALRRENWIAQWDETTWLRVSTILAIVCGIFVAILSWQYPSRLTKVFTSITVGLSLFYASVFQLSRIPYPMGFDPQDWIQRLFTLGTLVGSIGATVTVALIWRQNSQWMRVFAPIGGMSMFYLFGLLTYGFLVAGGFVQADY
ncbi:hypothetical protein [Pseudanabaena sp. FACHB-2040]|uniref:hypothetical protein n=1 Tax=Pseudanabaena sp. FACHB-2040 TaxID=2692859 RepID=UPI001683BEAB|nr:hypothetical protein [Pseudanabaena sp. FACHB-2040]MBD2261214.1 hypothetical protein [Pseudanabaena sp. FACHB-2040]